MMKYKFLTHSKIYVVVFLFSFLNTALVAQSNDTPKTKYPVVIDHDTLFFIQNGIGVFTAEQRAEAVNTKLQSYVQNDSLIYDSIRVSAQDDYSVIKLPNDPIMVVNKTDAHIADTTHLALAEYYREQIVKKLKLTKTIYSEKALINNGILSLAYLGLLILYFWVSTKIFPWFYKKIEQVDSSKLISIKIKEKEIISAQTLLKIVLFTARLMRFGISLLAIYLFVTKTIQLWPYTRRWELQPIIGSVALLIFYTALFIAVIKGVNSLKALLMSKYDLWKGTKIPSIKIKSVEVLAADRTVEFLKFVTKIVRFGIFIIVFYVYITIAFSLFAFSKTWASILVGYVLTPVKTVVNSFLNFLPNLFFIIVLVFVFNYLIKGVKFIFMEIDKGTLEFSGFHQEWAVTTYKIVRFLILILAAIVIFPYLPGSNSPFFQGISVFLGILFSLGSSSAIANMVSGVVLTYMRPFKLNDRVKIGEAFGDVVEKTLLVTRIRTIKNVDITIPNAMVLGSHIINYSSSASERGLILHTTVTIGYDVPWKQVHELLLSAAKETGFILEEPKSFILQTSLDDFYVSYELNAYTNNPGVMAKIYSDLHQKIQDSFNQAGVEILSPHYSAMRDGNKIAIPHENISKAYQTPGFRLFGINLFGDQQKGKE